MGSDHQNLLFRSEVRLLSRGEVLKRLHELWKEVEVFLTDKKSDLSQYFQHKKWVAMLAYLSDIFPYVSELNLKLQGPHQTIFNAWNKVELFKKKLKLWFNAIAGWNIEIFQSYSDYIVAADDFSSQNSVQILSQLTWRCCCCRLKSIVPNTRIPLGKICGLWTLLLNTNRQPFPMKKPFKLLNYHLTGLESPYNSTSNSEFWIRMKNE